MHSKDETRLLVLLCAVCYALLLLRGPDRPPVSDEGGVPVSAARLEVRVAGEVARPGRYLLARGASVQEALEAAGGALEEADLGRLNLRVPLVPKSVLRVPSLRTGFEPVISLNRSAAEDLVRIPGVGPELARRILAYRSRQGGFRRPEDLLKVPGIGAKKLRRIMEHAVLR